MYFVWQCPSFSPFAKWRLEFLVPSQSDQTLSSSLCSPVAPSSLPAVASHRVQSVLVYSIRPPSSSSSPSAQPFWLSRENGSRFSLAEIGSCTDCLHTWTWIFWSFCITQPTAWHDRHTELILIPRHVQEFDLAMLHHIWLFYVVVAYHVRFLDCVCKCNSVFLFVLFFSFCAMFSPLVASHFICDFLAFEQGLFCPMWMLTVSLQVFNSGDIFMSKKRWILYFPL